MYVKLFSSILTSSVWAEDIGTRVVWITMLALADRDGYVRGAPSGLARQANVPLAECQKALKVLESPDVESQSQEWGGRRIDTIEGGWLILNYVKYRDLRDRDSVREQTKERVRRHRELKRAVTHVTPSDQMQLNSDAEGKKPSRRAARTGGNGKRETWLSPYWDSWKAEMGGDPPGAIKRAFKPLRGRPEWEDGTLLRRWINFLTGLKVDPKYLGSPAAQVNKFASAHALYDDPDWYLSDRERASMEGLFG